LRLIELDNVNKRVKGFKENDKCLQRFKSAFASLRKFKVFKQKRQAFLNACLLNFRLVIHG